VKEVKNLSSAFFYFGSESTCAKESFNGIASFLMGILKGINVPSIMSMVVCRLGSSTF